MNLRNSRSYCNFVAFFARHPIVQMTICAYGCLVYACFDCEIAHYFNKVIICFFVDC